jgi:protein subunit release factor B
MAARRALGLSDEALSWECEFDVFVASGPGGQHRNKTESGVRLTHPATGIVITATERRSQLMNKGAAIERLREKLKALTIVPKQRRPTKPSRGAKERRLTSKKIISTTKKMRREKSFD